MNAEEILLKVKQEAPGLFDRIVKEAGESQEGKRELTNIEKLSILLNEPSTKTAMQNDQNFRSELSKIAAEAREEEFILKVAEVVSEMVLIKQAAMQKVAYDQMQAISQQEAKTAQELLAELNG